MSVILVGYRGSGKSTIGRRLASRLWWKFIDTDALITETANQSIKEIFEQHGEPYFREVESLALRQACLLKEHVIALGGGAVLREENRHLIKSSGCKVIYFRCKPAVLLQRIESDAASAMNRPNLTAMGGLAEVESLLALREPMYRELMTSELDVTSLTIDDAVVHISGMM